MAESRWVRIQDLVVAASHQPEELRDAFLTRACGGDTQLRRDVEALLVPTLAPELSREGEACAEREAAPPASSVPVQIGPWRIVRELGHGGMGTVYLAERSDGAFEKQVALKLVRSGLDTAQVLARFRSERQILAALDHPNVARLLDGGATADGRPYLVMEYVEGEDLLTWCERRGLDVSSRVALFRQVCAAVQYAHQKLVVHRDIKPANVLVAADGVPKLLDFGIAKLLDESESHLSQTGLQPLTPAYASPEQVRGEPVATATDVWSLGVLLFELLANARPFGSAAGHAQGAALAILTEEPQRPSAAIRAALHNAAEGARRVRALEGDLDNIILKALAKEPERRYSSAEQLSDDLGRHLDGLPVNARPATIRYRLGKLVRRHRWGVAAAALAVCSLVGGIIGTSLSARRARVESARADAARARAEELVDFMLGDLRRKLEPTSRLGILDDVARTVQTYFDNLPEADASPATARRRARLLLGLAEIRLLLGRAAEAAQLLAQSRAALADGGSAGTDAAAVMKLVADAASLAGRLAEERNDLSAALAEHSLSLDLVTRLARGDPGDVSLHAGVADASNDVGRVLFRLGRLAEAMARHKEALSEIDLIPIEADRTSSERRRALANTWFYLARADEWMGQMTVAEEALARGLSLERALVAEYPSALAYQNQLARAYNDLGRVLRISGQPAEAERQHALALTIMRELLRQDADHAVWQHDLAATYSLLGRAREAQGDLTGAMANFEAEVQAYEPRVTADRASAVVKAAYADALASVGRVERRLGKLAGASTTIRQALRLQEELMAAAPENAVVVSAAASSHLELGRLLSATGQVTEARSEWQAALSLLTTAAAQKSPPASDRALVATTLLELGRADDARSIVAELAAGNAAEPELLSLAARRGVEVVPDRLWAKPAVCPLAEVPTPSSLTSQPQTLEKALAAWRFVAERPEEALAEAERLVAEPKTRRQGLELLASFVRVRAPWHKDLPARRTIPKDVQRALSLLARAPGDGVEEDLHLDLHNVDIGGAFLENANLENVLLWGSNLQGVDLAGANLRGADLGGCDLTDASLERADLSNALLWPSGPCEPVRPTNLSRARLAGAVLRGADLSGADMTTVVGATRAQLSAAVVDESTRLPPPSQLGR